MRGLSPWRTNGPFYLTVSMWMSDRGLVDPDAVSITEVQKPFLSEVSSMGSDDTVRNAEPVDDVKKELDRLFQTNVGDGLRLYPFGEFVHCYE